MLHIQSYPGIHLGDEDGYSDNEMARSHSSYIGDAVQLLIISCVLQYDFEHQASNSA